MTPNASLQMLLDIEQIKQLKARYFRFVDAKEWDDVGSGLRGRRGPRDPGGRARVPGPRRDRRKSTVMEQLRTVHHGHMPEIEITGPDSARGVWAMFDYVEWPEQDSKRVGFRGYGHYVEEYVREDGEWRIAHTRLERLRVDPLD